MATIAEQLTSLANTKTAIKDAIVAKGVTVADTDPFSAYASKIGQISGGGAPATKFGVSIDNLLGNVDENGEYARSAEPFVLDLSGVKSVGYYGLAYFACGGAGAVGSTSCLKITKLIANDLTSVGPGAFASFAEGNRNLQHVEMNSLEEFATGSSGTFQNAFTFVESASFKKLRAINGPSQAGYMFQYSDSIDLEQVFPALEELDGDGTMKYIIKSSSSNIKKVTLSKLKSAIGGSSKYDAMFYSVYADFYFPNCTYLENYVCHPSNAKSLHLAAANQAAIEACPGYEYKFGAPEIYFDLMLTITVDGVEYSREYTLDGYTSWKDTNGNLVYTDATAEPAVGTIVYSDQGTTQVGTVSGVA